MSKEENSLSEAQVESPNGDEVFISEAESAPDLEPEVEVLADVAALEQAQAQAKVNWEKLLRKEAELQNVQRRAAKDVDNARKFSVEKLVKELFCVADSFEQALIHETNEDSKRGMQLTYSMFLDSLQKFGVNIITPELGSTFDPNLQEAISISQSPDIGPNCVMAVVQKGFSMHQRVLRAAKVVVSKSLT